MDREVHYGYPTLRCFVEPLFSPDCREPDECDPENTGEYRDDHEDPEDELDNAHLAGALAMRANNISPSGELARSIADPAFHCVTSFRRVP